MKPARYDIRLTQDDSYLSPLISVPDLTPFGGPVDLTAATVTAEVVPGDLGGEPIPFDVRREGARALRLFLGTEAVDASPAWGSWRLRVVLGQFAGTVLAGSAIKDGAP